MDDRTDPAAPPAGPFTHGAEVLAARVERWRPELVDALAALYDDPGAVADRLVDLASRRFAERPDDLHALDLRRSLAPDWFQRPDALGYAAYADRFAGTLADVGERSSYLRDLGVTYLHLMPLLEPRPAPNDGGYAVADYRRVRPDLGTTDDLRALTTRLRADGISLCVDLVLNHVAREHEWARRARAGEQRYRDYFHVFPDRGVPDAYEQTLPEVFPDFAPGSFTFDDDLDAWVWTTFNHWQWDVAWSNPDVLVEYADVVCFLANLGVEVMRLDAIAFTWKRLGTSCQNLPEVHALTQALRAVSRIACPAVVFKAEAIVGPHDLPAYLGRGRYAGKVSDLAYHNVAMVHLWSMLATRDTRLSSHALQQLPAPPSTTSWVSYARCHDDIGWAVSDEDAAAMGLDGFAHRRFLADFYAGTFPGSWSRGLVFQENELTGDRRTSGSMASLAGLESGDPHGRDRVLLAHAFVLGLGGLPVLWMGDEVGLTNDARWADDPGHADDNRWVHRPRMPWPAADPHDVRSGLDRLVAARKALPHLHASVPTEVLDPFDPAVFATLRQHPLGPLLSLYNVTEHHVRVPGDVLLRHGLSAAATDRVSGVPLPRDGQDVWLAPYRAAWLVG